MLRALFQERRRAAAIRALEIINRPSEPVFDRIVEKVASAFGAPVALLSFMNGNTQCFKACYGVDLECVPRSDSICTHVLDRPDLLECCDLAADDRFAALPPVRNAPHVRYYIGAPVHSPDGTAVGVLCVMDFAPRPPASTDQTAYLRGLARQAATAMVARPNLLRGGIPA